MKIEIFTEDSGTTAEKADAEQVMDFFKGGFLPVKDLTTELSSYGDVTVHILSEEYGYLRGSDSTTELESDKDAVGGASQEYSEVLSRVSQASDVVVILLTKSTFEETVAEQWETIVSNINPHSIWCFGVSRGAISTIDLQKLQTEARSVIVYERVGVARISTESKDELIEAVNEASAE